ncbi:hypothetical protein FZ983_18465 [Azospirillum sp. B21]|uniref:hypothetical protein n=1 Tax=Azospirillum sp. B21 TaxID=2607496 RepID=UPI0011F0987C|nr:hypothetical protein [Azospirillum sp. B21]KAA0578400.1 hypothetical protein FZ983_18465 [Azospirillum sp. B21]
MAKFPMILAFVAPALLLTALTAPADAVSLACQTVNGKTVCMRGSGSLSCVTLDGRTRCSATPSDPQSEVVPDAEIQLLPRAVAPDLRGLLNRRDFPFGPQARSLDPDDDEDPDL